MKPVTEQAAEAAIRVACRELPLPTIAAEHPRIAEDATRERLTHRGFLAEVLAAEVDERAQRRKARRLLEAHFPRLKRLEDFDTTAAPGVPAATVAALQAGAFIDAGAPVVLLGDSGTGKSHLLIGMGVAAGEAGRRVRYATTAALVNELVGAAGERILARTVARYGRYDLLCLDELGYLHWTATAPSCCSRSSPNARRRPRSPPPATRRSLSGARPSPTPPGRHDRGPAHLQRPDHRDRHPVLPAAGHPLGQEGSRLAITDRLTRPPSRSATLRDRADEGLLTHDRRVGHLSLTFSLPARRMRAWSLGNTPTTSVRRPISRLTRSSGLVDRSLERWAAGNP
jgi:DNA replication protein DnaC